MAHTHGRTGAIPEFDEGRQVLTLYYRALCGRACELVPYADDADLWQHPDTATTLRLPSRAPVHEGEAGSSDAWFLVAMTHRALHHVLGTFDLDLDGEEGLFTRLRPEPWGGLPALEQLVRAFGRTALATEVFAVLEDLRVDAAAQRLFAGIRPAYRQAMDEALADRPDMAELPPRSAVAEALVRLSLGAMSAEVAAELVEPLARVVSVARVLARPEATVQSSVEATIRVYDVLAGLPNLGSARSPQVVAFDELADVPDVPGAADGAVASGREELRLEGDEVFDVRFAPVRFRDVPGPRYAGQASSGMPLREAILRMSDDLSDVPAEASDVDEAGFTAKSLQAERGDVDVTAVERPEPPPEPLPHDHGPDLDADYHAAEGRMRASGRDEVTYPEWDSVAGRYLLDWCLLRLCSPQPVHSDRAFRRALAEHGHLLPGLVDQLRRVESSGRQLVLRRSYGDDLDLDACVEAMVDLRAGTEPSEHVFAGFEERSRDVAVAIAVDLSSSTAERLPPREEDRGAPVVRIIDLQRDAVSLLVEALERVGDAYGIYGFSGTGRADVRLSVVKDLDERRSPTTMHRLQGLRPDHTTRMAPALRHLTRRLARQAAATKLLLVVSDGRPFDLDYGLQHGEEETMRYALGDTARALQEARDAGVRPYLVTVDPEGGDYLGEICDDREYHVIDDAQALPGALAQLYAVARGRLRQAPVAVPAPDCATSQSRVARYYG